MIYGNITGIRKSVLNTLEKFYDLKLNKNYELDQNLISVMCSVTELIKKEISVEVDRKGNILYISVGDNNTVEMPLIYAKHNKLSGVCVIHTHPNGNSELSLLDISALKNLRLDYIAALGVKDGVCSGITFGFCSAINNNIDFIKYGPMTLEDALSFDIRSRISNSEDIIKTIKTKQYDKERAILIGIDSHESLNELEELSKACGVETVYKLLQNKEKINAAYYIGTGKFEEILNIKQMHDANVVIFDDELEGSQIRNIENILGIKVIDRTTLILEIFAKRAKTNEAKIQVELAQLKYRLPRLTGLGEQMSRTGGGIGTRGPGEKKLETDKRHIKRRIYELSNQLKKIKETRSIQRNRRNKQNIPQVALVGYTNAGKSTLRNKICELYGNDKQKTFTADMLFATLDTTVRAITLKDSRVITLIDTVGFVNKLPHELVQAFKSTLEEVIFSDLLLHVVDASSPYCLEQIKVVNNVLDELNALRKPSILVLNKIDKCDNDKIENIENKLNKCDIVKICAKDGTNIQELMEHIIKLLPSTLKECKFLIPYNKQNIVSELHNVSKITHEEYGEYGTLIKANIEERYYNKYKEYIIK